MTQANTFPVPNSQGVLCVGGQIGRYNASVFNTGATGTGSLQLDLANTPAPSGTVAIQAGGIKFAQRKLRHRSLTSTLIYQDLDFEQERQLLEECRFV